MKAKLRRKAEALDAMDRQIEQNRSDRANIIKLLKNVQDGSEAQSMADIILNMHGIREKKDAHDQYAREQEEPNYGLTSRDSKTDDEVVIDSPRDFDVRLPVSKISGQIQRPAPLKMKVSIKGI